MRIDLNADIGESFGVYELGNDKALLRSVTSVSIACGFHAGDPSVMRRTVRMAIEAGVAVGAHPGFPDLQGFGRRDLSMPAGDVEDLVLYQIGALGGIAVAEGTQLQHVKPHGALYNMAAKSGELAAAVVAAVAAFDRSLVIMAPPGSALTRAASARGLKVAAEAFADRAYHADGSLVSRRAPNAVIGDPETIVSRALRLVRDGQVSSVDGPLVAINPDTICVHGDTPEAATIASLLRRRLEEAGVRVAPLD